VSIMLGGMDQCVILWDTSVFEEEQKRKTASTEGYDDVSNKPVIPVFQVVGPLPYQVYSNT